MKGSEERRGPSGQDYRTGTPSAARAGDVTAPFLSGGIMLVLVTRAYQW
jgi:hypothetical protein